MIEWHELQKLMDDRWKVLVDFKDLTNSSLEDLKIVMYKFVELFDLNKELHDECILYVNKIVLKEIELEKESKSKQCKKECCIKKNPWWKIFYKG